MTSDRHQPDFSERVFGFGCAGLYGLPSKHDRRAMLDFAYAMGIRHFDVAPMYGLGLAESELGEFVRSRNDVTIATKFGIRPTVLGGVAGLVQSPIRRLLQKSPSATSKIKQSGRSGNAGTVGKLLYTERDYTVGNAQRSLHASLRALGTDHIEYFLVHEPQGAVSGEFDSLIDFLDDERRKGTIGTWGPAGDLGDPDPVLARLIAAAPLVQQTYDFVSGHNVPGAAAGRESIAFGFLGGALATARAVLDGDPSLRRRCDDLLGADTADNQTLVALIVRDALRNNDNATVLLSSTNPANLRMAVAAPGVELHNEAEVLDMIAARVHGSRVSS